MLNKRWGIVLKNVSRPVLKRAATLVFRIALISFALVRIISQQIKINDYKAQIARFDESIATLTERKTELENSSDLYSSDEYIEEIARTRLGYVRSDEVVFKRAED